MFFFSVKTQCKLVRRHVIIIIIIIVIIIINLISITIIIIINSTIHDEVYYTKQHVQDMNSSYINYAG